MRKVNVFLLIIVLPPLFLIIFIIFSLIRNGVVGLTFNQIAKKEASLINLPNEIADKQIGTDNPMCFPDFKTGGLRCGIRYEKFYLSDKHPCEKTFEIRDYLLQSSWKYSSDVQEDDTISECMRIYGLGHLPSDSYIKNFYGNKFELRLYTFFYGENEMRETSFVSCDESDPYQSQRDKNLCSIWEEYSDEYPYIYHIIIRGDEVN